MVKVLAVQKRYGKEGLTMEVVNANETNLKKTRTRPRNRRLNRHLGMACASSPRPNYGAI